MIAGASELACGLDCLHVFHVHSLQCEDYTNLVIQVNVATNTVVNL